MGVRVLHDPATERRDPFGAHLAPLLAPKHQKLVVLTVYKRGLGKEQLPRAVIPPLKIIGTVNFPVCAVADDGDATGERRTFA
jgi:hypothetical protein